MVTASLSTRHPKPHGVRHRLFYVVVFLKGLNGLAEIASGVALFMLQAGAIIMWIDWLTHEELIQNPQDVLAVSLRRWAMGFGHDAQVFAAAYLLVHGVVKVFLASILLTEKKIWAFPLALGLFSLLVSVAIHHLWVSWSWILAGFVAFDLFTIWVIAREWRALRKAG